MVHVSHGFCAHCSYESWHVVEVPDHLILSSCFLMPRRNAYMVYWWKFSSLWLFTLVVDQVSLRKRSEKTYPKHPSTGSWETATYILGWHPVTSMIFCTFLGLGYPNLNLHLPLLGKGDNPKYIIFKDVLFFGAFLLSVLVGLGIYTTDQDCSFFLNRLGGGFDPSVEVSNLKELAIHCC